MPSNFKDINFIAEEHCIKDAPWSFPNSPSMELAKVLHGDIFMVVVWDGIEGFRGRFPQGPQKVGDLLAMYIDDEDKKWNTHKEK